MEIASASNTQSRFSKVSTLAHTSETADDQLIRAARQGDKSAFGELVRRYQTDALRIATMALGGSVGAEDVVQEAFINSYRGLPSFRPNSAFKPWLYRIVVNTARNRQRTGRRQQNLKVRQAALAVSEPLGPDELAVSKESQQQVVDALNKLSTADRLILTYRWYDELSEADIAAALDCRPGTVKSRLHRASNRLKAQLNADIPSEIPPDDGQAKLKKGDSDD